MENRDSPLLEEEVASVFGLLVEMFDLVDEQLAEAVNAVSRCDTVLARRICERDDLVDALELKIDGTCERIIAMYHPSGNELRRLLVALKINADLERVGDHCKNMAKSVEHLESLSLMRSRTDIMDMADMVRVILGEARTAFVSQDRLLARQVLAHDRQVDRHHQTVVRTIVELCREQPAHAASLVHFVSMSKGLERIADHAKNIAQSVVLCIEGVDLRHRRASSAGF